MGLFRRSKQPSGMGAAETVREVTVQLYEGSTSLAVVGESYRQDNLWRLVGGFRTEYVREPCIAMLIPETDNQYDPNAIAVHISGLMVGYLARATASAYRAGLEALMEKHGHLIALNGQIIGGGPRDDGIGQLGVWLEHDPEDFVTGRPRPAREPPHIRTGTHLEAGGGGLSWLDTVPDDDVQAISQLRKLLANESNPLERHYMWAQLEHHLYHAREAFTSALADYDSVCRDHDAEMETICPALIAELGGLPFLELYRQEAIRHQHAHEYKTALWWAERGLAVYGDRCLNAEWTDDLTKRADKYRRVLHPEPRPSRPRAAHAPAGPITETLTCVTCGNDFDRFRARGRKPTECPACRSERPGPPAAPQKQAYEPTKAEAGAFNPTATEDTFTTG